MLKPSGSNLLSLCRKEEHPVKGLVQKVHPTQTDNSFVHVIKMFVDYTASVSAGSSNSYHVLRVHLLTLDVLFPINCILSEISPLAPDSGACTQKRGLSDPGLFIDPPWLSHGLSLWLEEEIL